MKFYSKTTGGFYDSAIHGENIPADAVEITSAQHAALLAAQSTGKRIEGDANGYPVAVDPPPPSQAVIIASLSAAIQKRLDDFAATRRYTNVDSLEKYKSLTDAQIATLPAELQTIVLRFRAECEYLVLQTAKTWAVSELIEARALAGNWPTNGAGQLPSDIVDIEAELPALAWPA